MCWEPVEMHTWRGMCKHTRKFPVSQNIKTELNKCALNNNFTSFSGTKFDRLQSALPCWFPIQYTAQKMFWYLLKSNYFILDHNCILLCTLIWCHTVNLFFLNPFLSSFRRSVKYEMVRSNYKNGHVFSDFWEKRSWKDGILNNQYLWVNFEFI